jgi:hypothetical protein
MTLKYHRYTVGSRLAVAVRAAILRHDARTVERACLAARRAGIANIVGEKIHMWALFASHTPMTATLAARVRFVCSAEAR